MAVKGGYKVIDLKGTAFTSGQEASVEGAYEQAANPYGKATMISGLIVSDVVYPDFFAPFVAGENNLSTSVVIGGNTISIVINSNDNVTVTVTAG